MTAQSRNVDVAIIGAGSAGLSARRAAKRAGASVLMIDAGPLGTTCARVGCMPSKLLIAAADVAHEATRGERFGIHVSGVRIAGEEVLDRVRQERDRFVGFVLDTLDEAREKGELLDGRARIVGPGELEVEPGGRVRYKRLILASGTQPQVPPPFRDLGDAMLTNQNIFELAELPRSLLVVGLGVIGLELGQAFHRLGVRTTLLGLGGLLGPLSDPEVLSEAARCFRSELDLHPEYTLDAVGRAEQGGVRIRFKDADGRARDEHFERVLVATGRAPDLRGLGLEALGLTPDEQGQYPINPDTLQLDDEPIFVAGDANMLHPLLHEAADDGAIAGANAATFPELSAPSRRVPLGIVFSHPQIAVVGQAYKSLASCSVAAGQVSYADQGRARVHGVNQGLVRIYADEDSAQLIGAEMLGPAVEHTAHLLAWAIQAKLTVGQALEMPFYHPVVEEGIRTALRDLNANLSRGDRVKCRVSELGVGS